MVKGGGVAVEGVGLKHEWVDGRGLWTRVGTTRRKEDGKGRR